MDEQNLKRRLIYLAGFMGSGKSTIGPILANTLGFQFVDVDKKIEEVSGKSVVSIFTDEGEKAFREIERSILKGISEMSDAVVSLGGGTVAHEENFGTIRSSGFIVYLQISPQEALRRMRNKSDRPMLKDSDGNRLSQDILEQRIKDLFSAREEFYRRADIVVPTENHSVGSTVDDIVRRLRRLIQI